MLQAQISLFSLGTGKTPTVQRQIHFLHMHRGSLLLQTLTEVPFFPHGSFILFKIFYQDWAALWHLVFIYYITPCFTRPFSFKDSSHLYSPFQHSHEPNFRDRFYAKKKKSKKKETSSNTFNEWEGSYWRTQFFKRTGT